MDKAIKKRIEEMSLEDKARQLSQVNAVIVRAETKAEITGKDEGMDLCEADTREVGSVLNFNGAADAIAVQDEYLSKSEGKIPLIFMQDVVHGFRTVFPVPLALGCSFDPSLAEACAEVSAVEAKYNGVQVTFSPMVDLVRDPRWGRVMESTGEDAYLNGEMGKAFVRGYHKGGILCCVKHFAAYGAAEAGKEYNTTDVSERNLKEYYLPAYRACVEEGADMVMSSFNLLNGVPVNGHKDLLVDTLRKEWGFDGVLISDYAAVKEMIRHGYLETLKECAETAINNQVDMEMMSSSYIHYLPELVGEGRVKEERIDESLRRVLELKQKAGLFENKYGETDAKRAEEVCLCPEHRALARRAAARTCVLLKNNGVLPLSAEQNIALAGPYAAEKNILGGWACWGRPEEAVSVYEGVRAALGREVVCAAGCGGKLLDKDESGIPAAVAAVKGCAVAVVCVGEPSECSGEATSRADLRIPAPQASLVRAVSEAGCKVVAVVFGGRPQVLTEIEPYCEAILYAWQPGTEGGNAVADLLFGREEPVGRLAMSFPRATGQCPIYYNCFNTGRPRVPDSIENVSFISSYRDTLNAPLYPFGYGLGYTEWELSAPRLSSPVIGRGGKTELSAKLKNTGSRAGETLVQLYIRDRFASVVRPVRELKAFRRASLPAGGETEVCFELTEEMLRFYTASGKYESEAGRFDVMLGFSSENVQTCELILEK